MLVAQLHISNADYIVIAGLPEPINLIIKSFVSRSIQEEHWMINVENFNWYPLRPPHPPYHLMDYIVKSDQVRNQVLSAIKITERISFFSYRAGWLNRRYGHFFII